MTNYDAWPEDLHQQKMAEVYKARCFLDVVLRASEQSSWAGKAGATDQKVLEGVIGIGWECGQTTFTASTRQIAERVGMCRETVGASLRERLQPQKWLRRRRKGAGASASTIEILDPCKSSPLNLVTYDPIDPYTLSGSLNGEGLHRLDPRLIRFSSDPDLFGSGGLSSATWRIFSALHQTEPRSAEYLAELTDKHRTTVGRSLGKLADVGLAVNGSNGWTRPDVDLDGLLALQAAAVTKIANRGRTARRREQYKEDRRQYGKDRIARPDTYRVGEEELFANLPEEQQDFASDLAKLAALHLADLDAPMPTFESLRRRAFRLVVANDPKDWPYEDVESLAVYIAT